jgi:hypothetical protein
MRLRIACSAAIAAALAVAAALSTGCVKAAAGDDVPLMCDDVLACPGGETCHDGICVGPTSLEFGAILVPPEGRTDLVITELSLLDIDGQGRLTNASFGPSVRVRGRIVLNSTMEPSVAASITFRRPSLIPGGRDYVVTATALGGVLPDDPEPAFDVLLPPTGDAEPYEVTIRPDNGMGYHPTQDYQPPDRLAAPLHLSWDDVNEDRDVLVPLILSEGLKNVRGRVLDAAGRGIEGMEVVLWGRQAIGHPLEIASSIGTTLADGSFSVFARSDGENTYDVEVTAGAVVKVDGLPLAGAPTLRRSGIVVEDPGAGFSVTETLDDIIYPAFGVPATYTIPVYGRDSGGTQIAANGANLVATTSLSSSGGDTVTYTAKAPIGADGLAVVDLIPGTDQNRVYTVQVIPASTSPIGAIWDFPIEVGAYPGTLAELPLPPRVFVTGRILDEFNKPAANVQVTPKLSLPFLFGLSQANQDRLKDLGWSDALTDADGRYALYLDAMVLGLPAIFDLELTPPLSSLQPRWSQDRVAIPEGMNSAFDVGDYALPPVSFAWGLALDPEGAPIAGADLKVYVIADPTLCAGAQGCAPPARLVDVAQSDENGEVMMSLPKPLPTP